MEFHSLPGVKSMYDTTLSSSDGSVSYEVHRKASKSHYDRTMTEIMRTDTDNDKAGIANGQVRRQVALVEFHSLMYFSVVVNGQSLNITKQSGAMTKKVSFVASNGEQYHWTADEKLAEMTDDDHHLIATYTRASSGASRFNIFKRGRRTNNHPTTSLRVSPAALRVLDEVVATCVYVVQKAHPHPDENDRGRVGGAVGGAAG